MTRKISDSDMFKVVGAVFIKQIIHCQVWVREGPAPVCSVLKNYLAANDILAGKIYFGTTDHNRTKDLVSIAIQECAQNMAFRCIHPNSAPYYSAVH